MKKQFRIIATSLVVILGVCSTSLKAATVDLQLSLLVDVSGSVDSNEYSLQMSGYGDAFKDSAVIDAILGNNGIGSIAVNLVQWAGVNSQAEVIGWTQIDSAASSMAFGSLLESANRSFSGQTAPQSALMFGTDLFASNGFTSNRSVIDVSGDGRRNSGLGGATGRDYALANRIDTINGLVIGGSQSVADYYTDNVIGGTDSFLALASNFSDFSGAVKTKLLREIGTPNPTDPTTPSAVPLPAAVWLFVSGLIGLLPLVRKQGNSRLAAA